MGINFSKIGTKKNIFPMINPPKASNELGISEHDESTSSQNKKSIAKYRADKIKGCYKESIMELIQKTKKHPPKGDIKRADFNR